MESPFWDVFFGFRTPPHPACHKRNGSGHRWFSGWDGILNVDWHHPFGRVVDRQYGAFQFVHHCGDARLCPGFFLAASDTTTLFWVVLFGIALGIWPGAVMSLPSQVLSPTGRSTGFGLFYTVYYLGMAILPPFAGLLQDRTGNAIASVLLGGFLMGFTILPLLGFRVLQWRVSPNEDLATETEP